MKSEQLKEYDARYKARDDYRHEDVYNNPYKRGTPERLWYLSEAQKIRFEQDESI